jgi:hypothetical protein
MATVSLSVKLGKDMGLRPHFMIREFLKPPMKHYFAYKRSVAKLAVRRPSLLVAVKRGLCGPDADRVIQAFAVYADAVERAHTAIQACPIQPPARTGFSSVTAYSLWLDSCEHWSTCIEVASAAKLEQYYISMTLLDLVFEGGPEKVAEVAYVHAFQRTNLPNSNRM